MREEFNIDAPKRWQIAIMYITIIFTAAMGVCAILYIFPINMMYIAAGQFACAIVGLVLSIIMRVKDIKGGLPCLVLNVISLTFSFILIIMGAIVIINNGGQMPA